MTVSIKETIRSPCHPLAAGGGRQHFSPAAAEKQQDGIFWHPPAGPGCGGLRGWQGCEDYRWWQEFPQYLPALRGNTERDAEQDRYGRTRPLSEYLSRRALRWTAGWNLSTVAALLPDTGISYDRLGKILSPFKSTVVRFLLHILVICNRYDMHIFGWRVDHVCPVAPEHTRELLHFAADWL